MLYTPDRGVLEGVTRKSVIDVARMNGIPIRLEVILLSWRTPVTKFSRVLWLVESCPSPRWMKDLSRMDGLGLSRR